MTGFLTFDLEEIHGQVGSRSGITTGATVNILAVRSENCAFFLGEIDDFHFRHGIGFLFLHLIILLSIIRDEIERDEKYEISCFCKSEL